MGGVFRLHAQLKELSEGGVPPGVKSQRNAENDEQIQILKVRCLLSAIRLAKRQGDATFDRC